MLIFIGREIFNCCFKVYLQFSPWQVANKKIPQKRQSRK